MPPNATHCEERDAQPPVRTEPDAALRPAGKVADGAACAEVPPATRISMLVVRRLIEVLQGEGCERSTLLLAAGLSEEALDTELPVSGEQLEALCEPAMRSGVDPALGLRWVKQLSERTFAPVSHTLMHTLSLRQALELLQQYEHLFCDQRIFELVEQETTATLRIVPWSFRSSLMRRFKADVCVAGFAHMICHYSQGVRLQRVCFAHGAPAYADEYASLLGPEVRFGQAFDGLVFERALLDRRNPDGDDEVRSALTEVLERRMVREAEDAPYGMRVRELLSKEMPTRLGMDEVARRLGLAERSLRRRLMAESVSFRDIQNEVCVAYAERLLRHGRATIQETAHAMGFSDASAFHRAFKRWTGRTPQAFRDQE